MLTGLTTIVGLALASTPATPIPDAMQAIAEFSTYCSAGRTLWPVSLCGPLLFVDPATKQAIASVDPGIAGFDRRDTAWVGSLPSELAIANTSIEIGGRRFAEILLPLPTNARERRILLSHESYHRIQPSLGFAPVEGDNAQLDERDARIYARLESAALATALTAEHWHGPARDALAFRAARLQRYPAAAAGERSLIENEGLAEYTGVRVGAGRQARQVALQRLVEINGRPSLVRSFGYVVGPAYGLLLDRTRTAWRTAAAHRVAVPDVLAAALGGTVRPQDAGQTYGAPQIVAEENARDAKIQQRRAELTSKLVDGPTVTFELEAMNIDFNPNTVFSLKAAGNVYSQSTTIRDHWGVFHGSGDVLLSPDWKFAHVPGPAKVNGQLLVGPGWTAELAPGYSLRPGVRAGNDRVRRN